MSLVVFSGVIGIEKLRSDRPCRDCSELELIVSLL